MEKKKEKKKNRKIFGWIPVSSAMANIILFAIPTVASVVCVDVWNHIHIYLPKVTENDTIVVLGLDAILIGIYIMQANPIYERVVSQRIQMQSCFYGNNDEKRREKNKEEFMRLKDLRIELHEHILLVFISVVILFFIGILKVDNIVIIELALGSMSFIITFWFLMAVEMDNPLSGFWRIEIPEECESWFTE